LQGQAVIEPWGDPPRAVHDGHVVWLDASVQYEWTKKLLYRHRSDSPRARLQARRVKRLLLHRRQDKPQLPQHVTLTASGVSSDALRAIAASRG
jgi:hypothetical protein